MERHYSFTSYLRGIATLLVFYSHWGVNFFLINNVCAELGYFQPINWSKIPIISRTGFKIKSLIGLDPGMMGVALFFLISGFLIESSIKKRTWFQFIITRCLRIYPLYITCLLFTCIVLWCSAKLNNIPFQVNFTTFFANATLTRLWFWCPGIDGVVWTLEIEMFFYLVACVLKAYGKEIYDVKTIICIDCISLIFIYIIHGFYNDLAAHYLYLYKTLFTIGHYLVFIPFILLGIVCRLKCDNKISKERFWVLLIVQLFVFTADVHYFYHELFKDYLASYYSMMLLFVLFMNYKHKINLIFVDWIRLFLDKVAEISFPFYAIHGAAGYAVLAILYRHCNSLWISYLISVSVFAVMAYVIHISLEKYTRKLQRLVDDKGKI